MRVKVEDLKGDQSVLLLEEEGKESIISNI